MKRCWVPCLAVALLFWWTGLGFAQQSTAPQQCKIPVEVWQKAQKDGFVGIIVELNVPWKPESRLDEQAVLAQRHAIAAAQDKLIASLSGTKHRVTGRLQFTPFIGLEVGEDALVVLELSPVVLGVSQNIIVAPAR